MSLRPPSTRLALFTDAMVEGNTVQRSRITGGVICTTPACRHTFWGHRLETDEPPWTEGWPAWLGRWRSAHGARVEKAVLAWETDGPLRLPEPPEDGTFTRLSALARSGVPAPPAHDVRRLDSTHWDALREMAREINAMGDDPGSRAYLEWYWDRARGWVDGGRSARFGVFAEGELVASCGLVWEDGFARFQDVMTRASHRRRGFARSVLCAAMHARAAEDPNAIFVLVVEAETPAESLYTSLGFRLRSRSVEFTFPASTPRQNPKPQPPRSG